MTDPSPSPDSPPSTMDVEVAEILEQFLRDQAAGTAPTRDEFLSLHPEIADRLAACLDGIDLFGDSQPRITGHQNEMAVQTPGFAIGDYEILGELGRGGMGVVYEAREKSLDRIVALKVMRFGVVDPRALDRFRREAETAGALHHTNIVPVYATGREGDTSWYAMQRIEGQSLADRIATADRDPITLEEILRVGIQAAEALDHAHQRDVVHRDVKPANLIIDGQDRVWLTDFGLARRMVDVGATMTGAILGTPRYMSPEQADLRRAEVDYRTDVYSLGATLYEMCTLTPPFDGDDPLKVISQIRYEEPTPIRLLRKDLPRDLEVVIAKCIEKDPDRRYATAAEFADDLRAIRDDRAIKARPVSSLEKLARWARKHHSRLRVAGMTTFATAATLLIAIAVGRFYRDSQLGAFRLRAAGGPYVTSIHPAGETSLSEEAIELTVPMQSHQKLPLGDYDMHLASRGKWSQSLRLPIRSGSPTEFRLRNDRVPSKVVGIEGAAAVAVGGSIEPAVLVRRDRVLERVSKSGNGQWSMDVGEVDSIAINLFDPDDNSERRAPVNFGCEDRFRNRTWTVRNLSRRSLYATNELAMKMPVDLDGDGRDDSVVAAINRAALLAIDADGNVLWARSFDPPNAYNQQNPYLQTAPQQPGILDLVNLGDVDADGCDDFAVQMAVFDQKLTKTEVCIAVLGGNDGAPIKVIRPAPLVPAQPEWPFDGILRFSNASSREPATLVMGDRVERSYNSNSSRSRISSGLGTRIPVPSPLQVITQSNRSIAVYHAGTETQCYELETGKPLGSTIRLPFVPATGPTIARTGEGTFALIFHQSEPQFLPSPRHEYATLVKAYDIAGKPLWQHHFVNLDWSATTWLNNRADWPLVVDADGDGADELLLPTSKHRFSSNQGLQCFSAANGKPVWTEPSPISRTAERNLHRLSSCVDIDGDGWREWVVASVAGPPNGKKRGHRSHITEAYVYVDWLSGKTGESLSWARHPIPLVANRIESVEIDAVRCDCDGQESGTVEVEFVTGDPNNDSELESLVVRFRPESPDATQMAAGLVACETPSASRHSARVYYRRPGPFGDDEEKFVFLDEPRQRTLRVGEQNVLATWKTDNITYIALDGLESNGMTVVDAKTLRTVWATPRSEDRSPRFQPVRRPDGSYDFLVQWDSGDDAPALLDGKTGRQRWIMSEPPGGYVKSARVIQTGQSVLIVGDGNVTVSLPTGKLPPRAFRMSLVDANNGKVRWSAPFLHDAPVHNYPSNFDDLVTVDLDGDGMEDVVGPDQPAEDKILTLAARNGANGDLMWSRPLFQRGIRTDYFIPFCVVPSNNGRVWIAYLGSKSELDQNTSLLLCDNLGDLRASHLLANSEHLRSADRDHGSMRLALSANGPDALSLLFVDRDARAAWKHFELSSSELTMTAEWKSEADKPPVVGVWLRDLNEDRRLDPIIAIRQRNQTATNLKQASTTLATIDASVTEPETIVRIADLSQISDLRWIDNQPILGAWLDTPDGRSMLLDMSDGEIVFESPGRGAVATHPTLISVADSDGTNRPMEIALPVRGGMILQTIGFQDSSFANHRQADPRRLERFAATLDTTLSELLAGCLRSSLVSLAVLVLPSFYIGMIFLRRQFSLAWMLMAPAVAMIALMVGQSAWAREPGLVFNLITGSTWVLVFAAYFLAFGYRKKDGFSGHARTFLLGCAAVVLVTMLLLHQFRSKDPSVQYIFPWSDLALMVILSLSFAAQFYWIGRIGAFIIPRAFDRKPSVQA